MRSTEFIIESKKSTIRIGDLRIIVDSHAIDRVFFREIKPADVDAILRKLPSIQDTLKLLPGSSKIWVTDPDTNLSIGLRRNNENNLDFQFKTAFQNRTYNSETPEIVLDKSTKQDDDENIDEGWKDWAASAALGAAALGGGNADAKPMPLEKPAIVQPAQQKAEPINILSNYPQHEAVLHKAARAAGIKGTELAQFMAQTKHESWDFSRLKEKGMGKGYFAKKYDPKFAPRTAKIIGNKQVGDGEKYHGRGFIQLTGRDNYRMAQDALNIPLLQQPALAERPDIAAKIAVWYWKTRVKPYINNFNDTKAVTQKINPAAKGLEARQANFVDYKNIL